MTFTDEEARVGAMLMPTSQLVEMVSSAALGVQMRKTTAGKAAHDALVREGGFEPEELDRIVAAAKVELDARIPARKP